MKALQAAKKDGAELFVVLYQGSLKDAKTCAEWCQKQRQQPGQAIPRVDIILCLAEDPLPPMQPAKVGDTYVVTVGHKGQHVGVIGAYRTNNANTPFQLRYQLVHLSPEFQTPQGKEKGHKLMELMEKYAQDVKDGNYLALYKQVKHPVQVALEKKPDDRVTYEGAELCKNCHPHAYKVWKESKHFKAYETLVEAKNPSNRQFDVECIKCHTTGFDYESGFRNMDKTAFLKGVGCESCHGPCSEHMQDTTNPRIHKLINEFKYWSGPKDRRPVAMGDFCQKCHDMDNDVHWDFSKRWPEVEHMTPRKK